MGNCAWFGAVRGDGLLREKDRRERECVAVLYSLELDGGRRATMWVSPQTYYRVQYCFVWTSHALTIVCSSA